MFDQLFDWWKFNFWLDLISLAVGLAIISPFLLSSTFRKRIARSNIDIEAIGLIALVVLVVAVGCYNYFGTGGSIE